MEEVKVGNKYGALTVVACHKRAGNGASWKCVCDCGNSVIVGGSELLKRRRTTCGKCGIRKRKDITGEKFNYLTALYPVSKRGESRRVIWRFRCDCGNEIDALGTLVSNGYLKSCGKCKRALNDYLDSIRVDYTEQQFEGIEVLERLPTKSTKSVPYRCRCKHCGNEFIVTDHALRQNCVSSCGCTYGSELEKEVADFVSSIYKGKILRNYQIFGDRREVDIYLPDKNLAIDVNGSFIHSDLGNKFVPKSVSHHFDRFVEAKVHNIRLINLFDIDWGDKVKDVIKDIICSKEIIYARNCVCKVIDKKQANDFFDKYHLYGGNRISKFHYGLLHNDELVSVMSFGTKRFSSGIEIIRYAVKSGYTIIGGANKLFKHFVNDNNVDEVFTYSDNDYFDGSIYSKLGFTFAGYTTPSYYWYNGKSGWLKREQCQPKLLKEKYPELYDTTAKSIENDIMLKLNYMRVHRAGNTKWIWRRGE